MSWATTYTPGFLRHVNHLVINGFYARDLDADDFAFLERVRVRGIANGELPCTNTVLVEELDFWHLPYAIAPNIERRAGPVERPTEAPERRELRELRSKEWHARRSLRAQQKEIEAAELERERQEWERANETRKRRELLSDAEWEAAAPKLRFGKIVKRHFVPQWKLDERGEFNDHDKRKRKREELKRKRQEEQQQRQEEQRAQFEEWQQARKREQQAREQEQERRLEAGALARRAIWDMEARRRQLEQQATPRLSHDDLKQQIHHLVASSPHGMNCQDMARALGLDVSQLRPILHTMVIRGELAQ